MEFETVPRFLAFPLVLGYTRCNPMSSPGGVHARAGVGWDGV